MWLDHYRTFWDTRLEALEAFLLQKERGAGYDAVLPGLARRYEAYLEEADPMFPVPRSAPAPLGDGGLAANRTSAVSAALDAAEKKSGAGRGAALTALAKRVDGYASGAKDAARVRMMSGAIKQLAAASK